MTKWINKEGVEYFIPTMGDFHLFSVMESLTKMARMKRRKELEYLQSLIEMYDVHTMDGYLSAGALAMAQQVQDLYNSTFTMNTDAYGKEHIPHYEDIMIEAAARGMREPFSPDYDKEDA